MLPNTGPGQLAAALHEWAAGEPWCEWLELAGSLGRGAGDEMSDVDAGLGVSDALPWVRARDETLAAVLRFAPVADHLIESLSRGIGPCAHLIVQYEDGRQLSLVVQPAIPLGLPPGAVALLDRTGALKEPVLPAVFAASFDTQREWAFLAWLAIGDVAKHARRGRNWRALTALDEARALVWRLHASVVGVDYPCFGAVSVENAGLPAPLGLERSLPQSSEPTAVTAAAGALAEVLSPLGAEFDVAGIRRAALRRLATSG